jgi:hypothetical protein
MVCLPQNYLRHGGKLEDLKGGRGINHRRHLVYPNLVQLKYDQINSNLADPVVRQCRGLILDENRDWHIVARPFDKFFNFGELHADTIDWSTATVQEKLDGSLMILYWYENTWRVATSGTPDAMGEVSGYPMTFQSLFWDIWAKKRYSLPLEHNRHLTFMFELTSPYNRIVVKHETATLRLIGARDNVSGLEKPARNYVLWDQVRTYAPSYARSFTELQKTFDSIDPVRQEGFVVVDKQFNRVKVKHPGYVALHHMRSNLSPKRVLEVVRAGEIAEVLVHFPEWREAFELIKARYEGLLMELEQAYRNIQHIVVRKNFAEKAKETLLPDAMFCMKDQKVSSFKEYLKKVHIDKLAQALEIDQAVAGLQLTTI